MEQEWRRDLEAWLAPFVSVLRHKTRSRMCPAYIAGLIGPGDRKSVQPMAARDAGVSYDRLHHFIASCVWDAAPLEAALLVEADRQVGGDAAWLIIDDTALPKKGRHSVGVAPQYASALGKNANCQTLVSLTLASGEVPVMVGLRLFLPENWTSDPARLERAGVPDDHRAYRTKPEIALAEIDRVRAAGARFGCVLADAGYGLSAPFRQGLSERGLTWVVGIPFKQKVYPVDVAMIFPVAGRGRPRQRHIPDVKSITAQAMLETAPWRTVNWRRGTKGAWRRASQRSVFGSPMARPSGSGTWALNICPVRKCGSSASTVRPANANIISPTFPPIPRSSNWPEPSKPVGSVSRRTSNSRKNSVSTTSKAAPGRACTGTRS
jgi:SRSO17 transposase